MKSLVRKWLMGETIFREYAKVSITGEPIQKVWMKHRGRIVEISSMHWLLCVEPLIFGVWVKDILGGNNLADDKFNLYFGGKIDIETNSIRNPEAILSLSFFQSIAETDGRFILLKVERSRIYHLRFIQRYLIFSRYYKKDGLTYQKFQSYVSAYSYPRQIRVVSFRDDEYFNIFPMDLLGDIRSHGRYVFGLRHTNVALHKIIATGKLVVSEPPAKYKEIIYELGNHHSSSPPALDLLKFPVCSTKLYGFYIPAWVDSYKEITILKTINLGSHMLLWGEQVGEERLAKPSEHLFLVHFLHYLEKKNTRYDYALA